MGSTFRIATFYKFVPLPNFKELRQPVADLGKRHALKGTVLLAPEGTNATVSGCDHAVETFLAEFAHLGSFENVDVKYSESEIAPFGRWRVRLKREIVTFKDPKVDPLKTVGEYVQPADWNALLSDPAVTVVDVRNRYEIEYGSFEGAVNPDTEDFWEFPNFAAEHLPDKSQPVALFCTGGIRCEKATSYLIRQGYENVKHLRGGILKYLEEIPEGQSLWQGSCFVFDDREALDHSLKSIKS